MKEFIIGIIIAIGIYKITELVFDLVDNIIKSNKWAKTKNEIVEYLKTLGKSEIIGYSDNICEAQIKMTEDELKKNIETLLGYSWAAKRLGNVFDWNINYNVLVYKITV